MNKEMIAELIEVLEGAAYYAGYFRSDYCSNDECREEIRQYYEQIRRLTDDLKGMQDNNVLGQIYDDSPSKYRKS